MSSDGVRHASQRAGSRARTSKRWELTFFPFFIQVMWGLGSPTAWHTNDATPPEIPVWSSGDLMKPGMPEGGQERNRGCGQLERPDSEAAPGKLQDCFVIGLFNSIQVSLFCIAWYHKLQICLKGLYNLYTYDIPVPGPHIGSFTSAVGAAKTICSSKKMPHVWSQSWSDADPIKAADYQLKIRCT